MRDNDERVEMFRQAATRFIETVDSAPGLDAEPFLAMLARNMAELYCTALALPSIDPQNVSLSQGVVETISTDRSHELHRSLLEKIGPLDAYWTIYDFTAPTEPVQGSLAGDILEIYCDLKESLSQQEVDSPKSDWLLDWRFDFRSHWGNHLLHALTAIHDRHVE